MSRDELGNELDGVQMEIQCFEDFQEIHEEKAVYLGTEKLQIKIEPKHWAKAIHSKLLEMKSERDHIAKKLSDCNS